MVVTQWYLGRHGHPTVGASSVSSLPAQTRPQRARSATERHVLVSMQALVSDSHGVYTGVSQSPHVQQSYYTYSGVSQSPHVQKSYYTYTDVSQSPHAQQSYYTYTIYTGVSQSLIHWCQPVTTYTLVLASHHMNSSLTTRTQYTLVFASHHLYSGDSLTSHIQWC